MLGLACRSLEARTLVRHMSMWYNVPSPHPKVFSQLAFNSIVAFQRGCVAGKLDLGVFVKEVTRGGPADRSGQVHAGDRIIAINGQSLEGLTNERAVDLIRKSRDTVELFLSQPVTSLDVSELLRNGSELSGSDSNSVVTVERASLNQSQRATPKAMFEVSPSPVSISSAKAPFPKPTRSKKQQQQHLNSSSNQNIATSGVNNIESESSGVMRQRSDSIDSSDLDIENYIPHEAMSPHTIAQLCSTPQHVLEHVTQHEKEHPDVTDDDESPRAMSPGEVEEQSGLFVTKPRLIRVSSDYQMFLNVFKNWRMW